MRSPPGVVKTRVSTFSETKTCLSIRENYKKKIPWAVSFTRAAVYAGKNYYNRIGRTSERRLP